MIMSCYDIKIANQNSFNSTNYFIKSQYSYLHAQTLVFRYFSGAFADLHCDKVPRQDTHSLHLQSNFGAERYVDIIT